MSIISLNGATLDVGGNRLLNQVDWQIEPKDRIALVGRNGAGKSSLLKLLKGELVLDSGQINFQSGLRVAGLTQDVPASAGESVYHFLVKGLGEAGDILTQYHKLTLENKFEQLADYQEHMDNLHLWDILPKVENMATRLGLDSSAKMADLSGGLKRRALLASALIAAPDLLLLDEPTNHLDMTTIEWLESYLKNYHGSLLVVTHDRTFLDQVANQIVEIDRGKLSTYVCNYDTFLERRESARLGEQKQNDSF